MNPVELIREEVRRSSGYSIEAGRFRVKLDANEFPYDGADLIPDLFLTAARLLPLNRYPDPGATRVRLAGARALRVPPESVMVGNGSDELIQILLIALGGNRHRAIVPVPTFVMYQIAAASLGYRVITVPLDENFDLDVRAILRASRAATTRIIFIAYPNNPTGNCFSADRIAVILERFPGLVVVDEAYHHFSGKSFLPLLSRYDRLVILRSLSKVGLAGVRLGLLIAREELTRELRKVKPPFNVGLFPQMAGQLFLRNQRQLEAKVAQVIRERDRMFKELKRLPGVTAYPSEANFVLLRVDGDADLVHRKLLRQGVSVKNFNGVPGMKGCLRVTVGRPEENRAFLAALKKGIGRV